MSVEDDSRRRCFETGSDSVLRSSDFPRECYGGNCRPRAFAS